MDHHDPVGAEQALGEDQRPNHIVRGDAPGIANDVGLTEIKPEGPEEVEAVINTHPGVQMSLAKARRSPIIGAIVVAEMVLSPATDAARAEASRRLGPKFSNHA